MGSLIDEENNGQPHSFAQADDSNGTDDEDGVFAANLVLGQTTTFAINVTGGPAKLDAWVDFNRNGVFDDPSERITATGGTAVVTGMNTVAVTPPGNTSFGLTFARFRLSTAGGLGPMGLAADGEVEDYPLYIYATTKIAFSASQFGAYDVYTVNADGSGEAQLTSNAADDFGNAWSPDGTKILFTSFRDGNYELYTMNVDGSNQSRLTNNALDDLAAAWSPDGSKIVFTRRSRDGNGIYVMNPDGSEQTLLASTPPMASSPGVSWSPDGRKIAFDSVVASGHFNIYVMNADGSDQTDISPAFSYDVGSAWSPDGSKIAFTNRDNGAQIYVMNVDGSGRIPLTTGTFDFGASWSPNGAKITFGNTLDGGATYNVYTMNADGSGRVRVTNKYRATPDAWGGIVSPPNNPPVAEAGGPFTVDEGSSVILTGAASSDPDGTIVSYEWDLDNNGTFEVGPSTSPTVSFFGADGDSSHTVRLRVTDNSGGQAIDTATVVISNVKATIALAGDSTVNEGATYTLGLGNVSDPGQDVVSSYRINWGDGTSTVRAGNPSGQTATHVYKNEGNYTITVDLTDEDGTHTSAGTQSVTANPVAANDLVAFLAGRTLVLIDGDLRHGGVNHQNAVVERVNGQFVVTSNSGTVNGADGPTFFSNVEAIHALMGPGNDVLAGVNLDVGGWIVFEGMEGSDTFTLMGNTATGTDVIFRGGDGDNTFSTSGNVQIGGVLDIVNGVGTQGVNLGGGSDQTTVGRGVFIHNGPNMTGTPNHLNIAGQSFQDRGPLVYVDYGFHSTGTAINVNAGTTTVGAFADFITGDGNDTIDLHNLSITWGLTYITQRGNDVVNLTGNNTARFIVGRGGDGDNSFALSGGVSTIADVIDIVNGAGVNRVALGQAPGDQTIVGRGVFVHNGPNIRGQANVMSIAGQRFEDRGPFIYVDYGFHSAATNIDWNAGTTTVGDVAHFITGDGNDAVNLRRVTIGREVLVVGNRGNDSLSMTGDNSSGSVIFLGGDGDNSLTLGGGTNQIHGVVDIHNGLGAQRISVGAMSGSDRTTVDFGVFIHNGPNTSTSPNSVTIGAIGAGLTQIGGPFIYVDYGPHSANTAVSFEGTTNITGAFEAFTEAGNDSISFNNTTTIGRHLLIVTRGGDDAIAGASAIAVGGPATFITDVGNDTVLVNGTFSSVVVVDVGLGDDVVHVGTNSAANAAIATQVDGPVHIFLGDGVNTLRVNDTSFKRFAGFFGGAGIDTVLVEKLNTGSRTRFQGEVFGFFADGNDTLDFGRNGDGDDGVAFDSRFAPVVFDGGAGALDHLSLGSNLRGTGAVRPGNSAQAIALLFARNFEDLVTV